MNRVLIGFAILSLGMFSCDVKDKGVSPPEDQYLLLAPRLLMANGTPVDTVDSVRIELAFGAQDVLRSAPFAAGHLTVDSIPLNTPWHLWVKGLRKAVDGIHWMVWWQGSDSGDGGSTETVRLDTVKLEALNRVAPSLSGAGLPGKDTTTFAYGSTNGSIIFHFPALDSVYVGSGLTPDSTKSGVSYYSLSFAIPSMLALSLVDMGKNVALDTFHFAVATKPPDTTMADTTTPTPTVKTISVDSAKMTAIVDAVPTYGSSGVDSVVSNAGTSSRKALKSPWRDTVALIPGFNRITDSVYAHNGKTAVESDTIALRKSATSSPPLVKLLTSIPNPDTVGWNVKSLDLSWSVTDTPFATAHVWLDGAPLNNPPSGNVWSSTVSLAMGRTVFNFLAQNANGDTASAVPLVVVRSSDTILPAVAWQGRSASGDTVPFRSSQYLATWKVVDADTLTAVAVNGRLLAGSQTAVGAFTFVDTLHLPKASRGYDTVLSLLATGGAWSDTTRSTVVLHVAADTTHPVIAGVDTTIVTYGTATGKVSWTVSDADTVVSVTATATSGGVSAGGILTHAGNTWSDSVSLASAPVAILVTATDSAGNKTSRTLTLAVAALTGDHEAPGIQREFPAARRDTIDWGTRSIPLSWQVTDNVGVGLVTNNGKKLSHSGNVWSDTGLLLVGLDTFALKAQDTSGNASFDTVFVYRLPDTSPPVLARASGTNDTVLRASTTQFTAAWTVTDNALDSVVVFQTLIPGVSGQKFGGQFNLPSGDSVWIKIVAVDSSGNTSRDSIKILRLSAPAISPHGDLLTSGISETAHIVSTFPGATLSYSPNGTNWTDGSSLTIATSQKLYAKATYQGISSDLDSAVFLYPPSFTPSTGPSVDTFTVTVQANGAADSVLWSTDGSYWKSGSKPALAKALIQTDTIYAKSYLGGVASNVDTATYSITHEATLSQIQVTPYSGTTAGTLSTLAVDASKGFLLVVDTFPYGTTSATLSATPKDPFATVVFLDGSTLTLGGDSAVEHIQVVNGPVTANYTVKIYAQSFGTFVDTRDNSTYRYVTIGSQRWMAQNLSYSKAPAYQDTGICYGNDPANCTQYGRLYAWHEVMAVSGAGDSTLQNTSDPHQGICPDGWHVPSDAEWGTLAKLGGEALKAQSFNGADNYGFAALPGGIYDNGFQNLGNYAYFWTAGEKSSTSADFLSLNGTVGSDFADNPDSKTFRASLRCIYGAGQ